MFKETLEFIRRNLWQMLLLVPGAIAITIVHEAAHAVAVLVQGGELLAFSFIPNGQHWGYVQYEFGDVPHSRFAISIAPYLFWLAAACGVSLLALLPIRWPFWLGCFVLLWCFVLPIGDIANAYVPWAWFGTSNDFAHAFATAGWFDRLLTIVALPVVLVWGWLVQRGILRDESLSVGAYLLLFLICAGSAAVVLESVSLLGIV